MKTTKRIPILILALILSLAALSGCESGNGGNTNLISSAGAELPKESRIGFYLDTVITLTAYTDRPELLETGLELCGKYEQMLSRTVEGSDVWKINHAEGNTVTVSRKRRRS